MSRWGCGNFQTQPDAPQGIWVLRKAYGFCHDRRIMCSVQCLDLYKERSERSLCPGRSLSQALFSVVTPRFCAHTSLHSMCRSLTHDGSYLARWLLPPACTPGTPLPSGHTEQPSLLSGAQVIYLLCGTLSFLVCSFVLIRGHYKQLCHGRPWSQPSCTWASVSMGHRLSGELCCERAWG